MRFNEVWVVVDDYPNYEVSNYGRVRNVLTSRLIQPSFTGKGYLHLRLCNEDGCRSFRLNRLVASHFIRPLNSQDEVNHKDGDKTNNYVGNLEPTTHSENIRHAYRTGLMRPRKKAILCVETNEVFDSITSAATYFGINQGNMSNVLAGRRRGPMGYTFQEVSNEI